MKKSILNLGKTLNKAEQITINGGKLRCVNGACSPGNCCHNNYCYGESHRYCNLF